MGITKLNSDKNGQKLGLKKHSFWAAVSLSLATLFSFTALYFPYQSKEQYALNLKNKQVDQQLFQAKIKGEINNHKRASFVAKHKKYLFAENSKKPKHLSTIDEEKSNNGNTKNISVINSASKDALINKNQDLSITSSQYPKTSLAQMNISVESSTPIETKNIFLKMTPLTASIKALAQDNFAAYNPNTKFSKVSFCKSLKWYMGVSGGKNYFTNNRNYSNVVKSQLSDLHYNLEDAKLISIKHLGGKQFNIGVNGGVQLFNRLDIEGGIVYHQSNSEFTSIFQNIIREEFTYVEWVPTGESGGPNGQPIYTQKDVSDYYLITKQDTVTTQANNYQIEVPLLFRYHLRFNKLTVFASMGSSAIIYSGYRVKTTKQSTKESIINSNNQFGMVQLNALFGAGISYRIMGGLELKIEPLFRPVIKSQDEFLPNFNSNSGSINAGVSYRF